MTSAWQLWLLWGFAVGVGTGSLALVFGAIVANRWFVKHRGVVIGVFSAASSTGQLVFLPAIAQLADGPGWRWAAALVAAFALLLVPLVWVFLRDQPSDVGVTPYGAGEDWVPPPPVTASDGAARVAVNTLRENFAVAHVLDPVRDVLDLRLVDQRADRHPLHPRRARPRHARDHQCRPARPDRDLRHRRDRRQRVAHRPRRQPLPAVLLLLLPRAVAAGGAVAARPATSSRACSCSSCSTAWTGWPPSRRPSRCAASTSASSGRASSSAGCSPRTWSAPASRPATPAGSAPASATTSSPG